MPERFFPNEKFNRHKGTYLTFGGGPRMCVGIRFAHFQLEVALAHIVKNFHIKLSANQKPIDDGHDVLIHFEPRSFVE